MTTKTLHNVHDAIAYIRGLGYVVEVTYGALVMGNPVMTVRFAGAVRGPVEFTAWADQVRQSREPDARLIRGVQFATKREARTYAKKAGFTVLHDKGYSGDEGYGSREYWTYPNCLLNNAGWPSDTLWLSKVGKVWIADQHKLKAVA